ncbi:MAG: hypothetical protein JW795_05015, partial [Chitinivibrionales bacterium]|nr:hypothetical protein [Chitinivibrionales bacterium]
AIINPYYFYGFDKVKKIENMVKVLKKRAPDDKIDSMSKMLSCLSNLSNKGTEYNKGYIEEAKELVKSIEGSY